LFGFDLQTVGIAAVGLIALVGVGGLLMRRRGSSEVEFDDVAAASDDPFAGFDTPVEPDLGAAATEAVPAEDDDLPAPLHDDAPIVKGAQMPDLAPVPAAGFDAEATVFDEAPTEAVPAVGDAEADLFGTLNEDEAPGASAESAETVVLNVPDLPGEDDAAMTGAETMSNFETVGNFDAPAAAPAAAMATSAGPAPEVEELERRLAQTEARLDSALEAAERLERTVTAQTEELRVQRAAIARTQRAVRNLSRGDENETSATEPAERDPNK
jgi:hypothetical protein